MICYIWMCPDNSIGVFPPNLNHPLWRAWLDRQDATKRKFVADPAPGYWLLSRDLLLKLQERCIEVGWMVYYNLPVFLSNINIKQNTKDPFHVFYLVADAPKDVVDVVYRHLIKQAHTDVGGNVELAVLYNNARDDIYRINGW